MCQKKKMRETNECNLEEFDTLDSSEKTIAILGDRWWPQAAKQEGDKIGENFIFNLWKQRHERPTVGSVSIINSRNGAPSRKGCVVIGQITMAKQQVSTPLPPHPPHAPSRKGAWSMVKMIKASKKNEYASL